MEGLTTAAGWILSRPLAGLGLLRITEETRNGRFRVEGIVDVRRLVAMMRRFRPLKGVVEAVLPVLVTKIGPRLIRLCLTKPEHVSKGDAALLVPRRDLPAFVLVRLEQPRRVELGKVVAKATSLWSDMELGQIIPDVRKLSSQLSMPFAFEVRGRPELVGS